MTSSTRWSTVPWSASRATIRSRVRCDVMPTPRSRSGSCSGECIRPALRVIQQLMQNGRGKATTRQLKLKPGAVAGQHQQRLLETHAQRPPRHGHTGTLKPLAEPCMVLGHRLLKLKRHACGTRGADSPQHSAGMQIKLFCTCGQLIIKLANAELARRPVQYGDITRHQPLPAAIGDTQCQQLIEQKAARRREQHALAVVTLAPAAGQQCLGAGQDRKSTRLNSSHVAISYAVFCLKKKTQKRQKGDEK